MGSITCSCSLGACAFVSLAAWLVAIVTSLVLWTRLDSVAAMWTFFAFMGIGALVVVTGIAALCCFWCFADRDSKILEDDDAEFESV